MNIAGEVQQSYKKNTEFTSFKMSCSAEAEKFFRNKWPEDMHLKECFMVAYVDNSNNIIGYTTLAVGDLTATIVDLQAIARVGLMLGNCRGVFMAHNHPSGSLRASEADKNITTRVKDALNFFSIKLIDHLILAPEMGKFSFTDEGMLSHS